MMEQILIMIFWLAVGAAIIIGITHPDIFSRR